MAPPSAIGKNWRRSLILATILTLVGLFLTVSRYDDIKAYASKPILGEHTHTPTIRKTVVTSVQMKDETTADWLVDLLPDWEHAVYVTGRKQEDEVPVNASRVHTRPLAVNQGREAGVYLNYIVENYDDLPDFMVFIHGKRYERHNDDPMLDTWPEINNLNLDYVREEGYASLRCNWDHCPGPQVEPLLGYEDDFWTTRGLYAAAWAEFFPNETIPTFVVGPCCAQFAVTREQVHQRSHEKYKQIRSWIWDQEGDHASMQSGIVLEYMWHIIFGKPIVYCPSAEECYCKKWGLCDLECVHNEEDSWCLGRQWDHYKKHRRIGLNPGLPEGWPEHGQDGDVWPYDGWWNDREAVESH